MNTVRAIDMNFFDTLAYAKDLEKAGFTQIQAETLAEKNKEIFNNNLVTKKDLSEGLAKTKYEMIKWFVGALVAQSAIIVSLIKFL